MHTYMYINMYIYIYTYIHIYSHTYIHTHICIRIHIYSASHCFAVCCICKSCVDIYVHIYIVCCIYMYMYIIFSALRCVAVCCCAQHPSLWEHSQTDRRVAWRMHCFTHARGISIVHISWRACPAAARFCAQTPSRDCALWSNKTNASACVPCTVHTRRYLRRQPARAKLG